MQWNDDLWRKLEQKYHFNVIFITPEQSPWGARFFANRLADHSWALVFLSDEAVIFLKRNALNAELIRRDEMHVNMKITGSLPKDISYQ